MSTLYRLFTLTPTTDNKGRERYLVSGPDGMGTSVPAGKVLTSAIAGWADVLRLTRPSAEKLLFILTPSSTGQAVTRGLERRPPDRELDATEQRLYAASVALATELNLPTRWEAAASAAGFPSPPRKGKVEDQAAAVAAATLLEELGL